jgi:hypothetical protein
MGKVKQCRTIYECPFVEACNGEICMMSRPYEVTKGVCKFPFMVDRRDKAVCRIAVDPDVIRNNEDLGAAIRGLGIGTGWTSPFEYVRELTEGRDAKKDEPGDSVNHPAHYQLTQGIEAIDVIRAVTDSSFAGYCRGNALKYLIRADRKGGVEDLKKARLYLDWEIEAREKLNED